MEILAKAVARGELRNLFLIIFSSNIRLNVYTCGVHKELAYSHSDPAGRVFEIFEEEI